MFNERDQRYTDINQMNYYEIDAILVKNIL